ncbi:hypothetical protein LSAT2_019850 [Lamellibrachia satsuma]|nr:hypothetical protein LSAT2_019850 [Lamellibrachia satsuma]
MAKLILLFSLLPAFVYAEAEEQTSALPRALPQDHLCACTVNVPPARDCGQTGANDNCLKESTFLAQMKELRQELATLKTGLKSSSKIKQCSRRDMNDNRERGVLMGPDTGNSSAAVLLARVKRAIINEKVEQLGLDTRKMSYIKECNFIKQQDDTVLRVAWNGDLRLIHYGPRGASCRRWYFTLNGKECRDPKTIDTQLHNNMKNINIHHPNYVVGYCRGLPAGNVRVEWHVGDCINQRPNYDAGDSYTGWRSTVRIVVEEVNVENQDENII